jgi:serine/threonine protein kinase
MKADCHLTRTSGDFQALEKHALKLTDFGCAVEVQEKTMKVGGGGTVVFMAPERLRGDPFSFPADIWSLGVIFFG